MRICYMAFVIFLLSLISSAISGQTSPPRGAHISAQERKALFSWFDTLEMPNLKYHPFVSVSTGERVWLGYAQVPPSRNHSTEYGFLLEEKNDAFTILLLNLTTATYPKTPSNTPLNERITLARADLKQWTQNLINRKPSKQREEMHIAPWEMDKAENRLGKFVIARACEANGYAGLAAEMCDRAFAPASEWESPPKGDRMSLLSQEIAHLAIWQAILNFEDRNVSRETLLKTFDAFVRHFPKDAHTGLARETAGTLRQMVAEDREHSQHPPKPFVQMTKKEKIAELIFQLREQNGKQFMQPGWCDIFMDDRGEKSPASQLVTMGFDAVPALIASLNDNRLTRSVGFWRNFTFSHQVLSVGVASKTILERITGHRFEGKGGEDIKQKAHAWWADVQRRGEKQILQEAVSTGGDGAGEQAERLAQAYPKEAQEAIIKGIQRATNPYVQEHLVRVLGGLHSPAIDVTLRQQLRNGIDLNVRLEAAKALYQRNDPSAVPAMLSEWARPTLSSERSGFRGRQLIEFLIETRQPQVMEALGRDLAKRSLELRRNIITSVPKDTAVKTFGDSQSKERSPSRADVERNRLWQVAIDRVLVEETLDVEVSEGTSLGFGGVSFSDPRMCDVASYVLSLRYPARYHFDTKASKAERDRQRITIYNQWRAANGLAGIPPPSRTTIATLPASSIQPLLKRIMDSANPKIKRDALSEIEALGLPALSPTMKMAATLKPSHPAKPALASLALRLACIVRETRLISSDPDPDPEALKLLKSVKNRPITPEALISLLQSRSHRRKGIEINAERDIDGTGFLLEVKLSPFKDNPKSDSLSWRGYTRIMVNDNVIMGQSSGGSSVRAFANISTEDRTELRVALTKALGSSPTSSISLVLRYLPENK